MNLIQLVIMIGIISVASIVGYIVINSTLFGYAIDESLKKSALIKDKVESLQKSMTNANINDDKGVNIDTMFQFKRAPEFQKGSVKLTKKL